MTLLEQALPQFDVNEVHAIEIRATSEKVYDVLREYRFGSSPLFRFLFGLRRLAGLPTLLARGQPVMRDWNLAEPPLLELRPFVKVAETPGEEVVLGLIGKFWQPAPQEVRLENGEAFLKFNDPAYARAAMNFRLAAHENGMTRLSTETRVRVPDRKSRNLFRLYWALIGFFSGWIRVEMLRGIKKAAEREK